jgi:hypothetical protein
MTRCFKPEELQRADEPALELVRQRFSDGGKIKQPCVG